ncbi:hypothetical protein [Weissella kandleri]|uniref:hypothetical protein n=1 Tax=Weissella kandleri TaxID=1616 RepID=UPI00070B9114|nr:hypothetical protein [Weissella kandleri]
MVRKFAIVKKYQDAGLQLPKRSTKQAAGYDIEAATDFTVPSIWHQGLFKVLKTLALKRPLTQKQMQTSEKSLRPVLVPTGLKIYMNENEYLMVISRSSGPLKRFLILPNSVGIIDSDYVDNPNNEGELFIQMLNFGIRDVQIKKGDRIAQGIFASYLKTDDDAEIQKAERKDGFGSTGE